ncbi:protein PFC0760c isoform X3 [Vespa crabro]|uniref:protein PFC0760c isoform X3 n=1 Tax=Vespa crabro TaxID=7445 RepID=UPI001EFF80BF|nr:protein PFC0760c isoform X3 [Vespa crabro]
MFPQRNNSLSNNITFLITIKKTVFSSNYKFVLINTEHTLQMNATFNAFQMSHRPEIATYKKHIRLKKSMNLPDDTFEYWGFYLLKGATVLLSVCSRFQGASILVVKGERNLRTCEILEQNENKERITDMFLPDADQVKITFETHMKEINSVEDMNQEINDPIKKDNTKQSSNDTYNEQTIDNLNDINREKFLAAINKSMHLNNFLVNNMKETQNDTMEVPVTLEETEDHEFIEKIRSKRWFNKTFNEQVRKLKEEKELKRKSTIIQEESESIRRKDSKMNINNQKQMVNHKNVIERLKMELNMEHDDNDSLENDLDEKLENKLVNVRVKRNQELMKPPSLLDQGIKHGGNADKNTINSDEASSVSSFENGLFNCYEGSILLTKEFEPSDKCINVDYLVNGKHMETKHDVVEDGYYYYIFYSDNDFVSNDIHALFDIYKPTFQYENVTKSCINQTECSFSLDLMSPDRVIVEIPTKDGIDLDPDEISLLISVCHPRMGVYVIFPIAVLFFILGCAFM